jgi:hypothetical protein
MTGPVMLRAGAWPAVAGISGSVRRTTIRAVASLAPLAAGALVMLAAAIRGLMLPWGATGLALARTGRYRNVGASVRDGAGHIGPSLEEAYLLLRGGSPEHEPTQKATS